MNIFDFWSGKAPIEQVSHYFHAPHDPFKPMPPPPPPPATGGNITRFMHPGWNTFNDSTNNWITGVGRIQRPAWSNPYPYFTTPPRGGSFADLPDEFLGDGTETSVSALINQLQGNGSNAMGTIVPWIRFNSVMVMDDGQPQLPSILTEVDSAEDYWR
jgi:hypothetical protein